MENTAPGNATKVKQTPKGVEMLIVCRARDIKTADAGAEVFGDQICAGKGFERSRKKYLAELRDKAVVRER